MYSAKFRERMVRKMMGPREKSASALSKEVGISQSTLSRWLRVSVPAVVVGFAHVTVAQVGDSSTAQFAEVP